MRARVVRRHTHTVGEVYDVETWSHWLCPDMRKARPDELGWRYRRRCSRQEDAERLARCYADGDLADEAVVFECGAE